MKFLPGRKATLVAVVGASFVIAAHASAAGPPSIASVRVEEVSSTGATLHASINPNGTATTYRFEYLTQAAYEANLEAQPPREAFFGATFAPVGGVGLVGSGTAPVPVGRPIAHLAPSTAYRYRVSATNSAQETTLSVARPFATQEPTNVFELLDHRGWEMVSPIEKSGGAVQPPGTISGGGVFQAAAQGGAFTFSSVDSFGSGAQGAPSGSQYIATRGGSGWTTANITTPLLSGSYGSAPNGVPFQLFAGDLESGLLSNGERCRGEAAGECPVANPPLAGSGAPAGYRDYYRRAASGAFESVLTSGDLSHTSLGPGQFELRLVAATPDLAHVVVSSCAALSADATEVAAPGGCDPAEQNLYEWSGGALSLINLPPGATMGTPGAEVGAPSGAISEDGSRVYFSTGGGLYLREGGATKTVSAAPGAEFAAASANGSIAYVISGGELSRYIAASETLSPVTAPGGVEGVLGASVDGSRVYYAESGAVFLLDNGTVSEVASSALPSDWPATTGTARVSADGSHLLFLSDAELTGFPSEGETEVFLYGPPPGGNVALLTCVSCSPNGERPQGSAAIPGARANGGGLGATDLYKPRVLSADGQRVFFESTDPLALQDTNQRTDVYEWEAAGEGTCAKSGGCIQLVSSGRDPERSYFLDADADGSEAFFLTAASLYPLDPGSYDVYVAREGGSFVVPEQPIPCVGDACQVLPEAPEDPGPGTLTKNSGNPPLTVAGESRSSGKKTKKKKKHAKHKKSGKPVRGAKKKHPKHQGGAKR
jgi:hypothetical protein